MSIDIKVNADGSYTVSCAGQSVTIGPIALPDAAPRRTSPWNPEENPPGVHAIAVIGESLPEHSLITSHQINLDASSLFGKKRLKSKILSAPRYLQKDDTVKISVALDVGQSYSLDEAISRLKADFSEDSAIFVELLPKIEKE